jgi:hypothetical protein
LQSLRQGPVWFKEKAGKGHLGQKKWVEGRCLLYLEFHIKNLGLLGVKQRPTFYAFQNYTWNYQLLTRNSSEIPPTNKTNNEAFISQMNKPADSQVYTNFSPNSIRQKVSSSL